MVIFLCCCYKQKTAYEMRISDWSSDVCSADLKPRRAPVALGAGRPLGAVAVGQESDRRADTDLCHLFRPLSPDADALCAAAHLWRDHRVQDLIFGSRETQDDRAQFPLSLFLSRGVHRTAARSEEHTSELQSLMRI